MFPHRMSKRHGRDPQPGAGMWGSTQNSCWIHDRAVGQPPPGTVPGHGERPLRSGLLWEFTTMREKATALGGSGPQTKGLGGERGARKRKTSLLEWVINRLSSGGMEEWRC